MSKQTAIRLPEHARRQLAELCERLGMNQSAVMLLALDRLYQQEIAQPSPPPSNLDLHTA